MLYTWIGHVQGVLQSPQAILVQLNYTVNDLFPCAPLIGKASQMKVRLQSQKLPRCVLALTIC